LSGKSLEDGLVHRLSPDGLHALRDTRVEFDRAVHHAPQFPVLPNHATAVNAHGRHLTVHAAGSSGIGLAAIDGPAGSARLTSYFPAPSNRYSPAFTRSSQRSRSGDGVHDPQAAIVMLTGSDHWPDWFRRPPQRAKYVACFPRSDPSKVTTTGFDV
jgi:hypothetical protein